eukprot:TRINITY_DN21921_c0_g1_i2.p1 TRINITY_DN21921_c0_g1~~TRINITY_DN21921_c0_g1_i2.p1  ORF type:complete len:557 (+),score=146.21 TRINITY_DN21921_c0_g1_i2:155-1672(+)
MAKKKDIRGFNAALQKLKVDESGALPHGKAHLAEFSSFLSTYFGLNLTNPIEIPGQYAGLTKPIPEEHITIVGFDPMVLIMKSMRRPKRVNIRGNDERDYFWLVKSGEDLRLDQRVEQLFEMMNQILGQDAICARRDLLLRTYQVVPMTHRVGIIEWVNNTAPLKGILLDQATILGNLPSSKKRADIISDVVDEFSGWIMSKVKKRSSGIADVYSQMIQSASKKDTVTKFRELEERIRPDLLAKAVYSFSSSPESFLTVRSRCGSSLAVLCVCLYILGIGDRHLENYLIDLSDGRVIGIDFGMAFGNGIDLPVPELMPIRFTRQFQNLFNPLDTVPLLKQSMGHVLKALRENRLILLQVMQVFAKEPHLDWQSSAKKFELRTSSGDLPYMDSFGDLESADSHFDSHNSAAPAMQAWYLHKLTTAQRKLTGWNSATIMEQELQYSAHVGKPYFAALQSLVQGDASSIRAKSPPNGLSVSLQLDCLIDHATDPNILGRTWQGWAPFV